MSQPPWGARSLKVEARDDITKLLIYPSFNRKLYYSSLVSLPRHFPKETPLGPWLGEGLEHTKIKARASSPGASGKCLFGQGREKKGLCSTLTHAGSFWGPAGCYYHWWHSAFSFPFSRATSASSFPVRQRWSRVDSGSRDPSTGKAVGGWSALALTVPTQAGLINSYALEQSEELQIAFQG